MSWFENYTKVYSMPITLHNQIENNNIRLLLTQFQKLIVIDVQDILPNSHYIQWNHIPKTLIVHNYRETCIEFHPYGKDSLVYPYMDILSFEEMQNEPISEIKNKNRFLIKDIDPIVFIKINKEECQYYVDYFINKKLIYNVLNTKRESKHAIEMLISLVALSKKTEYLNKITNELKKIKSKNAIFYNTDGIDTSRILSENVHLYQYQINDILWMRQIENDVINGNNTFQHDFPLAVDVFDNSLTLYNHHILPSSLLSPENSLNSVDIKYFGGNLISEVGLGKTIISLFHIFCSGQQSREKYNHFVEFSPFCSYFYKRGTNKGKACQKTICGNELFCKEHQNSPFIDKRQLTFKNLQDFSQTDFMCNNLFQTNACLVVCPNQLCDQWVQEYYTKFVTDKRVVLITTKDQYTNLCLVDILFADLVVVSYHFLINTFYEKNVQNTSCTSTYSTTAELFKSKVQGLNKFKWRGIYLDEAHEIENMSRHHVLQDTLRSFVAMFKWNITGTPFPNGAHSFFNLASYNTTFKINENKYSMFDDFFTMLRSGVTPSLVSNFNKLFRCNTRDSIKQEYTSNVINEHLKLLKFTKQERHIYDSYLQGRNKYSDIFIKLCCDPELIHDTRELVQNCKTLDEIQDVMLNHIKKHINKLNVSIKEQEENITRLQTTLERIDDEERKREMTLTIGNMKRTLTINKTSLESHKRTFNYLKSAVDSLKEDQETTCPICLDTIEKDQMTITQCGHKFCWECLKELYNIKKNEVRNVKCPSCQTLVSLGKIYVVTNKSTTQSMGTELEKIIANVKSTKVGNIIYFLKNRQQNNKYIIFSQWDELLHKVGKKLNENSLQVVYCNGSVYQRKKAIKSFTQDPNVNIIMLSSRNAASGINLTEANNIILLEPVYGSKEYRTSIENQAIGRANRLGQKRPIDVFRFIIENTIEHDIINNNIDDRKIKQLIV